ncbi:universal stress protein [Labedaea rhizosphaerae]|uniref:Universal stress protein family protein n=1 Tax=Labedaea rhizosphaerae TaxID=598644 RepID=A0A4R6SFQ5_LABRH|nr:universal stress protein [Labedaea rhizosphaerae]TDQ00434.1 universal stress protein family protein [Labedaea rhizosphaerae]
MENATVKTIVCGIDRSSGARSAVRVAAVLAERLSARLIAVHVRDGSSEGGDAAERVAADVIAAEVPDSGAQARGVSGDVAEGLAAVARAEEALMIVVGARRRGRSRAFLRARSAVGLVGLTDVPVLVAPQLARSAGAGPAAGNGMVRLGAVAVATQSSGPRQVAPDRVRSAMTKVEERRRLRRKARVSLRPTWSRRQFLGKRSGT